MTRRQGATILPREGGQDLGLRLVLPSRRRCRPTATESFVCVLSHTDPVTESRYLVINYGGVHATGAPRASWHLSYREAKDDVKRRLGVATLHRRARGHRTAFRPHEETRSYEGVVWRAEWAEDFSAVPAAHPDFGRSGGFTLYSMVRLD